MLRICSPLIFLALSATAEPIALGAIEVIDGGTIRAQGVVFRLVGLALLPSGGDPHTTVRRDLNAANVAP